MYKQTFLQTLFDQFSSSSRWSAALQGRRREGCCQGHVYSLVQCLPLPPPEHWSITKSRYPLSIYKYYLLTTLIFQEENIVFRHNEKDWTVSTNYMDRWILSFTQSLIKFVRQEMAGELLVFCDVMVLTPAVQSTGCTRCCRASSSLWSTSQTGMSGWTGSGWRETRGQRTVRQLWRLCLSSSTPWWKWW